jgi:hypothetical protein
VEPPTPPRPSGAARQGGPASVLVAWLQRSTPGLPPLRCEQGASMTKQEQFLWVVQTSILAQQEPNAVFPLMLEAIRAVQVI